jgi:hypothetical protein
MKKNLHTKFSLCRACVVTWLCRDTRGLYNYVCVCVVFWTNTTQQVFFNVSVLDLRHKNYVCVCVVFWTDTTQQVFFNVSVVDLRHKNYVCVCVVFWTNTTQQMFLIVSSYGLPHLFQLQ